MKLSIVIPAYNEELLLPACLKSLKRQSFPKNQYEIIVVNNQSTDKTPKIAKAFNTKLVYEPRRGVTYARQTGINFASGEIIVGIDADCQVPPDFLEKIASQFENKNLAGLCGSVYLEDAPLIVKVITYILTNSAHYSTKILCKTPICWAANFSFRKSRFQRVGGYDLNLPLVMAGFNAQGSDQYKMVERLSNKNNNVLFDKRLLIKTSGRRFKNRLFYWFFIEYLLGYVANERLSNYFGLLLPISSYERLRPALRPILDKLFK